MNELCSTTAPNSNPIVAHIIACMPSAATRNFHSSAAGKPAGTSSITGIDTCTTAMIATKTSPATIDPFHAPSLMAARRRTFSEKTSAVSEIAIIRKKSPVRGPIVAGSPTAGGFAGYLMFGTITSATNAPSASHADNARTHRADSPVSVGKHEREQSAERRAVHDHAGQQSQTGLRIATDEFLLMC